ncbi:hypothetical protein EUTSA_v10012220mg [Eutrema salsugineum]|uniref:SET domain-containing protein n=1 Tax=Eutrema salsugineum TaxID=72664 RepID=V4KT86_EUTSA|nr:hypothetical protein EUTSA_v10012220mg [Eutrema salsugineum]
MERGEGSRKFPGGEEPNTKNASNNDNSPADVGPSSGPLKRGRGRPKGSQNSKKSKQSDRLIKWVPLFQGSINKVNQETGNDELVSSLMMRFNAVRRRLSQVKNVRVPIGTNFMKVEDSGEEKRLAISVVSSGKNADEAQDPDSLIYTGFGGQESDQKLDRMNLSLEEALKKKSVVRVIRAVEDEKRSQGNVYIYDGLYSITEMWEEKSSSGFKVFKFRLVRQADQKPAFGLWKSIEQWKKELVTRPGLVLEDLSNGAENLKVSLVNEVDDEKGPSSFSYITSLKHTVIDVPPMVDLCTCRPKSCCSRDDCLCVQRNGGELPYVDRVLVTRRSMIYECGDSCPCSNDCKNKMIGTGLKFSLEVFKTMDRGWGLRSLNPIRAGSFICEFAGDIIQQGDEVTDDYIFDSSRVSKSFQWNYEPELVGEDASKKVSEVISRPAIPFLISAKKSGNVARFMNHSCSPNVMWQPISREEKGVWCIHIGCFAIKHIPPLMELTYDYGAFTGYGKRKTCLCRSKKCSGSF